MTTHSTGIYCSNINMKMGKNRWNAFRYLQDVIVNIHHSDVAFCLVWFRFDLLQNERKKKQKKNEKKNMHKMSEAKTIKWNGKNVTMKNTWTQLEHILQFKPKQN